MELALKAKKLGKVDKVLTVLLCCKKYRFPELIKLRILYPLKPLFFLLEFMYNDELFDYMTSLPLKFTEALFMSILSYSEQFSEYKTVKLLELNTNKNKCIYHYYLIFSYLEFIPPYFAEDEFYREIISMLYIQNNFEKFKKFHVSNNLKQYSFSASPEAFDFIVKKYGYDVINIVDLFLYGYEANIKKYVEHKGFTGLIGLEKNCDFISSPFYCYYGIYSAEILGHLVSHGNGYVLSKCARHFRFTIKSFLFALRKKNVSAAIFFFKYFRITNESIPKFKNEIWKNWPESKLLMFLSFMVLETQTRN